LLQLGFHLGAAAEASFDLDVAQLRVDPVVAPQPPGDEREDQADAGESAAEEHRRGAQLGRGQAVHRERGRRNDQPQRDEQQGDPRDRPPARRRRDLE
jgi:hypothetical protein